MPVPAHFSNTRATDANPNLRKSGAIRFGDSLDFFEAKLPEPVEDEEQYDEPYPNAESESNNLQISGSNFLRRIVVQANWRLRPRPIVRLNRLYVAEARVLEAANVDAICIMLDHHTENENSAGLEDPCIFSPTFSTAQKVENMQALHNAIRQ